MIKKDKETLIVSCFAGPGSGKSTTMAGVFAGLKLKDVNCEMVPEYAKGKVWEQSHGILKNQIYLFAKQYHSIERVRGKVDVIITDSPILLGLIYDNTGIPEFKNLMLAVNKKHRTLNFLLKRNKRYNPSGRLQNEEEAKELDKKIKAMMDENAIKYETLPADKHTIALIIGRVCDELNI